MAHLLDINFARQTRRVSVVAVVLLLAGLASVGMLALECDPLVDATCGSRIARRLKQGAWLLSPPPPVTRP